MTCDRDLSSSLTGPWNHPVPPAWLGTLARSAVVIRSVTGLAPARRASLVILLTPLAEPMAGGTGSAVATQPAQSGVPPWSWVLIFVAVAVVAAWMKRVSASSNPSPDPAYADAHRLLSELH